MQAQGGRLRSSYDDNYNPQQQQQQGDVPSAAAAAAAEKEDEEESKTNNTTTTTSTAAAAIAVLTRALTTTTTNNNNNNKQTEEEQHCTAAAAAAARSFLDQTGSVYVLDSNSNNNNALKIFGCWNFLHQALNEMERYEEEQDQQMKMTMIRRQQQQQQLPLPRHSNTQKSVPLLPETRLLAEFAVKVARRSDESDQRMVTTCIENYCGGTTTNDVKDDGREETKNNDDAIIRVLLPQLIQTNVEMREIVTGRIAAYAFHYNTNTNHQRSTSSPTSTITTTGRGIGTGASSEESVGVGTTASTSTTTTTVFEDPLVIESFCKFLAVNAVSNGPEKLQLFLKDWIIPGASGGGGTAKNNNSNNDTDDDRTGGNGSGSGSGSSSSSGKKSSTNIRNNDDDHDDDCYDDDDDDDDDGVDDDGVDDDGIHDSSLSAIEDKRQRLVILASQASSIKQQQPQPMTTTSTIATTNTTTTNRIRKKRKRRRIQPSSSFVHHHHHHYHDRLPPYSLACVLYHIASEAALSLSSSSSSSSVSPYGTVEVLQRLSLPVMANVILGPVLHDSLLLLQRGNRQQQQQYYNNDNNEDANANDNNINDRTIAMGIQAISAWCKATDLSLAQVKHIGSKVRINLVEIFGEALQTDSPRVMNAIADLIEYVVERHTTAVAAPATITKELSHQKQHEQPPRRVLISNARMTQTRYLMQVDEVSFRSNVTQEQLHTIETKELSDILHGLSTHVENQRHRFPLFLPNQAGARSTTMNGNNDPNRVRISNKRAHSLGHSLARVVAAVCLGYGTVTNTIEPQGVYSTTSTTASTVSPFTNNNYGGGVEEEEETSDAYRIPGSGFLELIWKCASHPSVAISGIVLPVVTPVLRTEVGLATQWLPTLQRRAIILHQLSSPPPSSASRAPNNHVIQGSNYSIRENDDNNALVSTPNVCLVDFDEFMQFRETVLTDSLIACYAIHPEYYLASCTAAIEEFCCCGDDSNNNNVAGTAGTINAEQQTSFHLEAALFCIVAVAEQVLPSIVVNTTNLGVSNNTVTTSTISGDTAQNLNASTYLLRCTTALAKKSRSLDNPLTMAQACRFVRKYSKWFCSDQNPGILDISADLILFVLSQCCTNFSDIRLSRTIHRQSNSDYKPFSQAAKTLRCLLFHNPKHFLSNMAISALGAGWEATFVACNRNDGKLFTIEDRKDACIGICHVLASLPNDQQQTSLMALALASIACLEAMVKRACGINYINDSTSSSILSAVLHRVADEIIIISTTARAFTDALSTVVGDSTNGVGRMSMAKPSLTVLRRAWPTISTAVSNFSFDDSILNSLGILFSECIPPKCTADVSISFLREICALSMNIIENEDERKNNRFFCPILTFIERSVEIYGERIDRVLLVAINDKHGDRDSSLVSENEKEMYHCLESLTRQTVNAMIDRHLLGHAWTSIQKQGNGQSAFETKKKDGGDGSDSLVKSSSIGLAPFFSLLSKLIERCPVFLLQIFLGSEAGTATIDYSNDDTTSDLPMLRETMASAVSSILHSEAQISIQAMKFIESVVSLTQVTSDTPTARNCITNLTNGYNLRYKTNVLCTLLEGMCGMFQPTVIPYACRLLLHVLSSSPITALSPEELKTIVSQGLSREYFVLGDKAWRVVYESCVRCSMVRSKTTIHEVENIMTDIWQLHRLENTDLMAKSDVVHSFCNR